MIHKAACVSLIAIGVTLSACDKQRVVEPLPTPSERLICERVGTRPTIPPEHKIDWSQVKTIPQAQVEHEKVMATVRTREGIVAGYVLKLEGVNFICYNNMAWRRDFEAGIR